MASFGRRIAALLNDFQNYLLNLGLSTSTTTSYLGDLRQLSDWFYQTNGQKLSPAILTQTDLREYRAWLVTVQRAKPATINRHLAAIRAFAKCNGQPMDIKGVTEQEQAPHWLDRREAAALTRELERALWAARTETGKAEAKRNINIIVLLLHTGLRISELCNLQPADIDLSERKGSITVQAGKGMKNRTIPLNIAARNALKSLEIPITIKARTIQRMLEEAGRRANLEVTPHRLRHTFAKSLIDAGRPLTEVAALLGHASLDTTRLYTIPGQQDLIRAVASLDD
jgi:integrase/recombinase XerC